mmetsp:Transcript_19663/g.66082  ORF Transcript_19663/g.66082 Transcript_19663/m.66082 type:complete len:240 (+) Transcript_19663:246-965(+)
MMAPCLARCTTRAPRCTHPSQAFSPARSTPVACHARRACRMPTRRLGCAAAPTVLRRTKARGSQCMARVRVRRPVWVRRPVCGRGSPLLLGDTDRAALAAGGLGVLPAHADAPVVAEAAVGADLLEALEVLAELEVEVVGADLGELAVLVVLLPIQEPVRDLELARVLDDGHHTLNLLGGQLARALLEVDLRLLEHHVGEPPAHAADASQCEHHLLPAVDVGVQHAQDVLEVRARDHHG